MNFNDVNPRAAKSSTSVVYGIGGVLLPVKNHCPETRRVTEYVSTLVYNQSCFHSLTLFSRKIVCNNFYLFL